MRSHSFLAGIAHPQLPQYATSIIMFSLLEESAQPIGLMASGILLQFDWLLILLKSQNCSAYPHYSIQSLSEHLGPEYLTFYFIGPKFLHGSVFPV